MNKGNDSGEQPAIGWWGDGVGVGTGGVNNDVILNNFRFVPIVVESFIFGHNVIVIVVGIVIITVVEIEIAIATPFSLCRFYEVLQARVGAVRGGVVVAVAVAGGED